VILLVVSVAVALSMDAFAVAVGAAAAQGGLSRRQLARLAWHFGLFQGLMALLGWFAGAALERWVAAWDHWLAAALLTVIGLRMVVEAVRDGDPDAVPPDATRGWSLVGLSVATSIDALAAGVGLAALAVPPGLAATTIAVTAAAFTVAGGLGGRMLGARLGRVAGALGGIVLLGVAVSIPWHHLAG